MCPWGLKRKVCSDISCIAPKLLNSLPSEMLLRLAILRIVLKRTVLIRFLIVSVLIFIVYYV